MTRPPWLSATRPAAPAREPPVPRSDVPIARPTRGAGWHVAVGGPGDKPHQSGRARSTPALRTMRRDARKRRAGAADGAGTEQTAAATQAPPPPFAACTQFLLHELLARTTFLLEQISHQQSASSTFLSDQISISYQPPTKLTGAHHHTHTGHNNQTALITAATLRAPAASATPRTPPHARGHVADRLRCSSPRL
jgi:hypothetical protein